MHVVSLTAPVDTKSEIGILHTGEWLMHDQNAFEVALMADRGTATLMVDSRFNSRAESFWEKYPKLIFRSGAIGDLLLMSAAIKAYRKKNYGKQVFLSCRKRHADLFDHTGLFDEILPYPMLRDDLERWELHPYANIGVEPISLENIMELATDVHATDAFAAALGVTVEDYKPVYVVTEEEKKQAAYRASECFKCDGEKEVKRRPWVGMQLRASTRNRDYPAHQWAKVILGLVERGWEVFLFGKPGQIPPLPPELKSPYIHDCSQSGMTFRETAAMLSLCDAFVGVDSALIHLCHALDIPAVGLFAAFDWKTRTAKAPLTHALTGIGECAPCSWHDKNGQHFPPNKPCRQKQLCSVLASIPPERIIAKVNALKP